MPKKLKKLDRRGVDLTLNTIIIAVLVVLVLVVVIVFFIGGFRGLTDRIKATFFGTTAGTDRVLAVQACEQYCEQAKLLPKVSQPLSAYCTQGFIIEGEHYKTEKGKYNAVSPCGIDNNLIVDRYGAEAMGENLKVACPEIKCKD